MTEKVEVSFTHNMDSETIKQFVSQKFTDKQIEDTIAVLYMYIELAGSTEMSNRIHGRTIDHAAEQKLQGVAEFAAQFQKFLKNSWQTK